MSLNRWKVLACTLTIGVGGLAVFATPPSGDKKEAPKEVVKEPALLPADLTVKPTSPANGDDTPAPIKQVRGEVFDLQIPEIPPPTKPEAPAKKSASEPVFEPVAPPVSSSSPLLLPAKAESDEPPMVLPPVPAKTPSKANDPKFSGNVLSLQLPTVPTPDLDPPAVKTPEPPVAPPAKGGVQLPTIPAPDLAFPVRAAGGREAPPDVKLPDPKPTDKLTPPPAPIAPPSARPVPTSPEPPIDLGPVPVPASKPVPLSPPVPATKPDAVKVPGIDFSSVPTPITKPEGVPMRADPVPAEAKKPEPTKPVESLTFTPMGVPPDVGITQPIPPNASIRNGSVNFTPTAPKVPEPAHLKMLLRMGDGQPRFEIRNTVTTVLLLKVYGEKIEMQTQPESRSSLAGVSAVGHVRFTAPGIEGTCDQLTILSATGEVLMKGNIRLKAKRGKSWSEMTAEKMVYQVGTSGLNTGESHHAVRPASYIPD